MRKSRKKKLAEQNVETPKMRVLEQYPLEMLQTHFLDHKRLRVFAKKGCTCVECGIEGTILILRENLHKQRHVDLYTKDMVLMTVDHINPKHNGGSEHIDNLQPMCTNCNRKKADIVPAGAVFTPEQIKGTPESWTDDYHQRDGKRYDKTFGRPREFYRLDQGERDQIDYELGVLDWEGGCHHRHHQMCRECKAKYNEYYE